MAYHRFIDKPKVQVWGYKDVEIARLDKDDGEWPMIATVQEVNIGDKQVSLILCHTCKSSQHSQALYLLDSQRCFFNENLGVLKGGVTLDAVKELYSNVRARLEGMVEAMHEDEKWLLESKRMGSISCDGYLSSDDSENDLMSTLKDEDWIPSLHTTMVVVSNDRVICAGPGEMSVVAGDGKEMKLISSPKTIKELTLVEEVISGQKVVVISSQEAVGAVHAMFLKTGETADASTIAKAALDYNVGTKVLVAKVKEGTGASA